MSDSARAQAFLDAHPDLEKVEFLMPDLHGVVRGKWGPAKSLVKAFTEGVALPYSTFGFDIWGRECLPTGLHIETGDKDGICLGVPGTIALVPWASQRTAQVLMGLHTPDRAPWFGDGRHVLQRVVDRFLARGLTPVVAFELEFYLLRPDYDPLCDPAPVPIGQVADGLERQHMYSINELDKHEAFFADVDAAGRLQDVPLDTTISEAGPGQFEINLNHRADCIRAADDAVLLSRMICGTARKHGLRATFMAKPFPDWPGNGMHMHVSLIDREGNNIFAGAEAGEARLGHAVQGCLETMPEALALFINGYNGYRRLAPNSYAPTRATWGTDNRSVAVRIPNSSPQARRLEHRMSGADANPHLALAGILAGMLYGLDAGRNPPPPVEGSAYEGHGAGETLSDDMRAAIDRFSASDFIAEALGKDFRHIFSELKHAERDVFASRISRLEYETYL
ncbi:MAG: glutamine synthetase family protein [Pseudomonadota bacterium]